MRNLLITAIGFGAIAMQAQTMYVRSLAGDQTSFPIANIQKLTFLNDNLLVTNGVGSDGTFALIENRYINFADFSLDTNVPADKANKFYVYPNPTNQWLSIAVVNSIQTPILVEIISIDGKLLAKHKVSTPDEQINMSALPSGMYLCKISSKFGPSQTHKFYKL